MTRGKKIVRNIVIIIFLFILYNSMFSFYYNPIRAYKNSERSLHYGPSQIVHIEDFNKDKYILGKYDKWFSCSLVTRHLFFRWHVDGGSHGHEIDKAEPVNYSWSMSSREQTYRAYGVINDDRVEKIEIILSNGEILKETTFYEDMFLVIWEYPKDKANDWGFRGIRAYDANDNIVFEFVH